MNAHLRIARPVRNLEQSAVMYERGLDFKRLGAFEDHDGFDGVMLGAEDATYHLEFTYCHTHPVAPAPTSEDLLVFYVPEKAAWQARCRAMVNAGFIRVDSPNPYWSANGATFEDLDGYRVVLAAGKSPFDRLQA
ncbi:MAG: VOC family protein [Planctomycetes bacterium]|nr:VOC family protein [Planctomycetota bacterium]MCP4770419.1 VOC family protein [Planctomycetota bacterium]MCP4860489.1 VOC family protein [Planctomycetota bacterium]